jgi:hypothetical protein
LPVDRQPDVRAATLPQRAHFFIARACLENAPRISFCFVFSSFSLFFFTYFFL